MFTDTMQNCGETSLWLSACVRTLVWELDSRYACDTSKPSDLLKKQKKIEEYSERNVLYFISIILNLYVYYRLVIWSLVWPEIFWISR